MTKQQLLQPLETGFEHYKKVFKRCKQHAWALKQAIKKSKVQQTRLENYIRTQLELGA